MEFLGWYTIGGSPTKEDVDFHEQVSYYLHYVHKLYDIFIGRYAVTVKMGYS